MLYRRQLLVDIRQLFDLRHYLLVQFLNVLRHYRWITTSYKLISVILHLLLLLALV